MRGYSFVFLLVLLVAAPALAQVEVKLTLPIIQFEAPPPLVVVSPGIQVVPDYDEEVFFIEGSYWVRRNGRWFRTRDHRGHWVAAERSHVPPGLLRLAPGKYRRYRQASPPTVKAVQVGPRGQVNVKVKRGGKHGR